MNLRNIAGPVYTIQDESVGIRVIGTMDEISALLASNGVNTEVGPVNFLLKLSRKDGMGGVTMASKAQTNSLRRFSVALLCITGRYISHKPQTDED